MSSLQRSSREAQRPRRSVKLLVWPAVPVLALAGWVQATGAGLDILLIAAACFLLLAAERTIGDWLGELLGSGPMIVIVATVLGCGGWYLFGTASGTSRTAQFFAAAEERGYRTAYFNPSAPAVSPPAAQDFEAREATSVTTPSSGRLAVSSGARPSPVEQPTRSERQPEDDSPGRPVGSAGTDKRVARSVWSIFRRDTVAPSSTALALSVTPARVRVAQRTQLRAAVTAAGHPVTEGSVEFSVNGMSVGRVALDADGIAVTTYWTHIPGTYQVQARFPGTRSYSATTSDSGLSVRSGASN